MASDASDEGSIVIHGRTVQRKGKIAPNIRSVRSGIGFVFQQFNLVGRLPVIINVLAGTLHAVPMWRSLLRWFTPIEKVRGIEALRRVGNAECAAQRSSTLSGGQQ